MQRVLADALVVPSRSGEIEAPRSGACTTPTMQRDLDALTALVGEDVDWPDGDERLHGRAAVRNYWSHQWARIHTQDKVAGITDLAPDRAAVRISRVIRDSSPQASSSTPTSSRTGWSNVWTCGSSDFTNE